MVSAIAPQGGRAPKVGGKGVDPGGPPPEPSVAVLGDVTGLYEAFTGAQQELGRDMPCLLVQLNQAGHAVAGWFTRPEQNISPLPHLRLNVPPAPKALEGVAQGVLLGQFARQLQFNWGDSDRPFVDPTPDELDVRYAGVIELLGSGKLRMVFRRRDVESELFLRQAERTARWSNRAIEQLLERSRVLGADRFLRESFRGKQAQPSPLHFYHLLAKDLQPSGLLGDHISNTGGARAVGPTRLSLPSPKHNRVTSCSEAYPTS